MNTATENIVSATSEAETPVSSSSLATSNEKGPADLALNFEDLFNELAPYILRVVPRMGVAAADVDDVAQEVFLAVHRGLGTFEGRSSTRTWVYGICIRVCADYRRKQARRREQPTTSKSTQQEGRTPERALAASETLNALDAALANLADGQRDIFVLYEIEGLSMPEVSAALGCPLFTAYARLHAARRRVRTDLVDHLKAEK